MEKTNFKKKSLNGILLDFEERKAGQFFIVTARIETECGKIWSCQFWNEAAIGFLKTAVIGKPVYIEGAIKEDNNISVKYFRQKNTQTKEIPSHSWSEQVTYEVHKGKIRGYSTHTTGRRSYRYENANDFINVEGKLRKKLAFIYEKLPDKYVTPYMSDFTKSYEHKITQLLKYLKEKGEDFSEDLSIIFNNSINPMDTYGPS